MPQQSTSHRRICFVTGSRAEFGLMATTLAAIRKHPKLRLQIVATGMHLDPRRGETLREIQSNGRPIDAVVPWRGRNRAAATGTTMAGLAAAFEKLDPHVILVVGDRVEAFAAAAAGQLSDRIVAHVHGGDRALGQADDSLRHAITKLAHVHFPATDRSAARIRSLGEDAWRVHCVGSPGIDGIRRAAAGRGELRDVGLRPNRYALVVLHPIEPDDQHEFRRASQVLAAVAQESFDRIVVVYPNNDPGSGGIVRYWKTHARGERFLVFPNVLRPMYLALLRDAAVLVGNSSSGIIEAPSFGTPVIDVGPRQRGRERAASVRSVSYSTSAVRRAVAAIWNDGKPIRTSDPNPSGGSGTGRRIGSILAALRIDDRLLRKLIAR